MAYLVKRKVKGHEYLYNVESYREGTKVKQRLIRYYGDAAKPSNQLIRKQNWNLERKVDHSLLIINEFYERMNGKVCISFSGGKDSIVLLHLVRKLYPEVPAVFCNTGMEFPEIVQFVKTIPNVIMLRPEMSFNEVIETEGYPIISKLVSRQIFILRNPTSRNAKTREIYTSGYKNKDNINRQFQLAEKWKFLLDAPFKINNTCCRIMKHRPFAKFEKETGLKPYIGTMASDSSQRQTNYYKTSCNSFGRNAMSRPLSIWNESDVWDYIQKYSLPYSKIYDLGWERTGCMFCCYGLHMEQNNRFEIMKETHPSQYEYCMEKLGLRQVLEYLKKN